MCWRVVWFNYNDFSGESKMKRLAMAILLALAGVSAGSVAGLVYQQNFSSNVLPTDGWTYWNGNTNTGLITGMDGCLTFWGEDSAWLGEAILDIDLTGFQLGTINFYCYPDETEVLEDLPPMFLDHYSGDGVSWSFDGGTTWLTNGQLSSRLGMFFPNHFDAMIIPVEMPLHTMKIKIQKSGIGSLSLIGFEIVAETINETVTVPNVVNMTKSSAEAAIRLAGLTIGTSTYSYSNTIASGNIISQSQTAGTSVASWTTMNIVVSKGPQISIPDVVGMTQSVAQTAITSAGLKVGTVSKAYSNSLATGYVIIQNPTSSAIVVSGTSVNIMVSLGIAGNGNGTGSDPCLVYTAAQMNAIGANSAIWNKYFKLMADIDMSAYTGTQYNIIGNGTTAFTGTFDGNGHIIRHLTYKTTGSIYWYCYAGLFGATANATIRNLGLEDVNITAPDSYAGGLIGYKYSGIVENCYITGKIISGSNSPSINYCVGGLVGLQSSGNIINCHNAAAITSASTYYSRAGGLVGFQDSGIVENCYNNGMVTSSSSSSSSDSAYAGGLIGYQNLGIVAYCYNTGTISSVASSSHSAYGGGLMGQQYGGTVKTCYNIGIITSDGDAGGLIGDQSYYSTVADCYSTSSVASYYDAGGLVGQQSNSVIKNCYSTGTITASSSYAYAGGLLGRQYDSYDAKIQNCYSTGTVSVSGSSTHKGGFLGYYSGSGTITNCVWDANISGLSNGLGYGTCSGVVGRTTAQMKTQSTFTNTGWDFVGETVNGTNDVWRMCADGINYPHFRWEYSSRGDFGCPDGTDFDDFITLTNQWLWESNYSTDIAPFGGDGIVNILDFAAFAENWMK
jgi:hypothetical protein